MAHSARHNFAFPVTVQFSSPTVKLRLSLNKNVLTAWGLRSSRIRPRPQPRAPPPPPVPELSAPRCSEDRRLWSQNVLNSPLLYLAWLQRTPDQFKGSKVEKRNLSVGKRNRPESPMCGFEGHTRRPQAAPSRQTPLPPTGTSFDAPFRGPALDPPPCARAVRCRRRTRGALSRVSLGFSVRN